MDYYQVPLMPLHEQLMDHEYLSRAMNDHQWLLMSQGGPLPPPPPRGWSWSPPAGVGVAAASPPSVGVGVFGVGGGSKMRSYVPTARAREDRGAT